MKCGWKSTPLFVKTIKIKQIPSEKNTSIGNQNVRLCTNSSNIRYEMHYRVTVAVLFCTNWAMVAGWRSAWCRGASVAATPTSPASTPALALTSTGSSLTPCSEDHMPSFDTSSLSQVTSFVFLICFVTGRILKLCIIW